MKTTIGFTPTVDVDLSQPLAWPNLDGTVTVWPPEPGLLRRPEGRYATWAEREPDLRCTSDDPTNHQGDTCPIHEGDAL